MQLDYCEVITETLGVISYSYRKQSRYLNYLFALKEELAECFFSAI